MHTYSKLIGRCVKTQYWYCTFIILETELLLYFGILLFIQGVTGVLNLFCSGIICNILSFYLFIFIQDYSLEIYININATCVNHRLLCINRRN